MIKNIVFDFGDVLLDLDIAGCYQRIQSLLRIEMAGDLIFPERYKSIFEAYEMGHFSEGSFMHRLQRSVGHLVTERQILDAWNSMLIRLPLYRLEFLREVRKRYKVYLLSNTNTTHLQYVYRVMLPSIKVSDFESVYFDEVYYSHLIKRRKPDYDIYKYVQDHARIDPHETLFIDDNIDNVRGAQAFGWHAVCHDPTKEITEELEGYIRSYRF